MSEEATDMSTNAEVSPTFAVQAGGETPKAPAVVHEEAREVTGEKDAPMNARQWADKFNSPEDLEKSYLELQKKLGESQPKTSDMDLDGLLGHIGLDGGELAQQWMDQGKLTEEQYSAFQNVGLGRNVVNEFLTGQQARATNTGYIQKEARSQAEQMAGGAEELDNLFNWAGKRYQDDPKALERINERLGDPKQYQGMIKELLYDFKVQSGAGFTQPLVEGQAMPNVASGFSSVDEFVSAMKTAREQGFSKSFLNRLKNTPAHIKQGIE